MAKTTPEQIQHEQIIETPTRYLVLPTKSVGKILKTQTTPSVKNIEHWVAQNTGAVAITDFVEGQEGQDLFILGDGQTTLTHGTKIFLTGAANLLLAADTVVHLKRLNNKWYQI